MNRQTPPLQLGALPTELWDILLWGCSVSLVEAVPLWLNHEKVTGVAGLDPASPTAQIGTRTTGLTKSFSLALWPNHYSTADKYLTNHWAERERECTSERLEVD